MKILLVVDGSSYSNMAIEMIGAFRFTARIKVAIMTVVPEAACARKQMAAPFVAMCQQVLS